MAVAHFALGLTYFYMKQYNKSRQSYEKCQKCLRGNIKIDYTQLGLKFVLWECDVSSFHILYFAYHCFKMYAIKRIEELHIYILKLKVCVDLGVHLCAGYLL